MEFVNANRWRNERMYILEVNNILKASPETQLLLSVYRLAYILAQCCGQDFSSISI